MNYAFQVGGKSEEHGVITRYASQTLSDAATFAEWREKVIAACRADAKAGRLPERLRLSLTVAGDSDRPVAPPVRSR
jgi:hypothetical protein